MSENLNIDIERMGEFFNKRADGYEEHMKNTVEFFDEYYKVIAQPVKETDENINILDLGCGTGLEIDSIFSKVPNAKITGIDLSEEMLEKLQKKYESKIDNLNLIKGSYLTVPFKNNNYDYVVSSMTMHHFVLDEKLELYKKIKLSLKSGGKYIEGDYVVSKEYETEFLNRYYKIMNSLSTEEKDLYHIDIPFTIETQKKLFKEAGFKKIEIIWESENNIIMVVEA